MRDNLSDIGTVPSSGPLSQSPDIILSPHLVEMPQSAFGAATWMDGDLGTGATAGETNYVYVRVKNRGKVPDDVTVTLYWTQASSFLHPLFWTLIGSVNLDNCRPHRVRVSPTPIEWEPPSTGHYCLIALVSPWRSPVEMPSTFSSNLELIEFFHGSNKVCFRNVQSVAAEESSEIVSRILLRGGRVGLPYQFVFDPMVPKGTTIELAVAGTVYRGLGRGDLTELTSPAPDSPESWEAPGALVLDNIFVGGHYRVSATLTVRLPKAWVSRSVCWVAVEQYYKGELMGRFNLVIRRGKTA